MEDTNKDGIQDDNEKISGVKVTLRMKRKYN